jgi:hypothetical protein
MTQDIIIPSRVADIQATFKPGNPLIVFSHGFGVLRDSRGMFTEIAASLPASWGYLLFDYYHAEIQDGTTHVYLRDYDDQKHMLQAVLKYAAKHADSIHLIGHSRGTFVAADLQSSQFNTVLLLAPPLEPSGGRRHFTTYPGAWRDDKNILIVPRRDGTITHIPDSFFDQAESSDPYDYILRYAETKHLTIIQALGENVLEHTPKYFERCSTIKLAQNINVIELEGNHNFDPPHRDMLVRTILKAINEEQQ